MCCRQILHIIYDGLWPAVLLEYMSGRLLLCEGDVDEGRQISGGGGGLGEEVSKGVPPHPGQHIQVRVI